MLHHMMPGDIVFTRGTNWLSKTILRLSRSKGEEKTETNHVGIVVTLGNETTAMIVEALWSVKCHTLRDQYGGKDDLVCVYRPLNVTPEEMKLIVAKAMSFVGKPYGPLKLVLHAGDQLLGGVMMFRRLAVLEGWPICSYVVAAAYWVAEYLFGVEVKAAQPDDIWDFCITNKDKYSLVRAWNSVSS